MCLVLVFAAVMAKGCVAPDEGAGGNAKLAGQRTGKPQQPLKAAELQQTLDSAYAAFEQKQLDAAMSGAQRVLVGNPAGPGAAEAHYLCGRVLEERATQASNAGNGASAKSMLQSAREAYNAALTARPTPAVEGRIHAQIANVAYFQDDYSTAIAEGTAAMANTPEPQAQSWILYRVGLSQQRFGNFPEADRTFAAVQQKFPNTEPARRAAAHQGAKGFYVQIGVFNSAPNADSALAALRTDGVIGIRLLDASGRNVVRVGPVANYDQARGIKSRLAGKYPDAVIIP
jgi:TolA-binding protein